MTARAAWTLLWPGLARLWLRGQWQGLVIAVGFGVALNTLLVTTFLWPRLIGGATEGAIFNGTLGCMVLCFWGASVYKTWHLLPRLASGADTRGDDALFLRAQTEYLRGNWYDAEKLLGRLLSESPRDADAQLLLASLYRQTSRFDEARKTLAHLERLDGGGKWLFEIHEERRRLSSSVSSDETVASNEVAA